MPVEPQPCAPGGGSGPVEVTTCCSPSIASTALCRADGTAVLLVVRSGCVECGATAEAPAVIGWIDPATGAFTPGAAPADTGPCDTPGCVETICVQRCDDTDGDGTADQAYSELWCVRADGTTELLLTYSGDPSAPYNPVSPVECAYGCPEHETVMLCDSRPDGSVVPFLRRYVFLNGAGSFEDVAVDGQTPHVVLGTVGVCSAAPDCDSPTTPVATVGLCLPGGMPIAVVLTRDCDGATRQDGWINLSTGLFTAGDPPAGARACGDSRAFELTGVLCDTDPATGDVLGLVLVQYAYNPDGSLASVELLDPAIGDPYALQGELRICPGGDELPEQDLAVLCDVQADGTRVPFLRDWRRDTTGAITGYTDYTLDGAPYGPSGTVGVCQPEPGTPPVDVESYPLCVIDNATGTVLQHVRREVTYDATGTQVGERFVDAVTGAPVPLPGGAYLGVCPPPAEECRDSSTLLVCDLPAGGTPGAAVTDTDPTPYYPFPVADPVEGAQTLWDGGTLNLPPGVSPQPGTTGRVNSLAATIQAPRPGCDTGTAHVAVVVSVQQKGPDNGCGPTGHLRLFNRTTQAALTVLPAGTPAGYFGTLTVEADVPAADLAAGNIAFALALDAYDDSGGICPGTRSTGWQLSAFTATVVYDQAGCTAQVFANVVTDCETGAVQSVTYTLPDGTPYEPQGTIGQCETAGSGRQCCPAPGPECGDTEIAQLCDLTYDPQTPIPTPASDFTLSGNVVAANDGTTLWFAQANQEANGVAELTVGGLLPAVLYEFRFASAWIGAGAPTPATNNAIYLLEILDGATVLAARNRNVSNGSNVFPGGVLSEDVPPLAFIAPATGAVTIRFTDQTTGSPVNDRDLFLMPLEVRTAALTLTSTPFLRRFTFDCGGNLTSTQDLGLDGVTPYEVQGEAGQCAAAGGQCCSTAPECAQHLLQEYRWDDTTGDGLGDTAYVELITVDGCTGDLTSLGTYLPDLSGPYEPVSPATDCPAEGAPPARGVQARRIELAAGQTWDADAVALLQSVTATAHGGNAQVATADGTSTLFAGETATWSVARDADTALTGPLTITAQTAPVTITFTRGVQL
ncbi:hypothetical protein ACFOWE_18220 [Planomonospora corallina]|uniref:Uncharacterized protein n=1 Tax=Planomonospora corallina TaxID=1806052 RepID=A0ABV8I8D8_9ACTN